MKKTLLFFVVFITLFSCVEKPKIKLQFLDEFIVADSIEFEGSLIGGISGIDYAKGKYFMVVDDAKNPRFVTANIDIKKDTISSIHFLETRYLKDSTQSFFNKNWLDLESIFVDEVTETINFVSEGAIKYGKNPLIFSVNISNDSIKNYPIPTYFEANSLQKPKHNATFESSSKGVDNKGFWVGMEGVLEGDGEDPTFTKTNSPVRITYFDKQSKKAVKQFVYQLDKINNPPKGTINLNGVTAILEYKKNMFFIVERAYQSGYGTYGNSIRIYEAIIDANSTNTLNINSLKNIDYQPLKKRLLLNFKNVKQHLTNRIIDNIEGIAFGPKLSNGNQSLILVSDDNFQKYGKQLNQFLLIEIIK